MLSCIHASSCIPFRSGQLCQLGLDCGQCWCPEQAEKGHILGRNKGTVQAMGQFMQAENCTLQRRGSTKAP